MPQRDRYIMAQDNSVKASREGSFGFLLQLLARRMDSVMKESLAEIDVDLKIFSNLRMLAERDGVTQRELGRIMEFPEYYTSRNVDALVEAGYVERRPDPNSRRSVLVFMTDKGRKKAEELPALISKVNRDFLGALTKNEQSQVITLLQKIAELPQSEIK